MEIKVENALVAASVAFLLINLHHLLLKKKTQTVEVEMVDGVA